MASVIGRVLLVQEGRFKLLSDNGQCRIFLLAPGSGVKPDDLAALLAGGLPTRAHIVEAGNDTADAPRTGMARRKPRSNAWTACWPGRPREPHEELSPAVRGIVGIRDALIARRRAGDDVEADLAEVNKLVTTAVGAQFPISDMQWDRVERVRDGLQAMVRVL